MNWNHILADSVTEDNVTSTNTADDIVTNETNNIDSESNPKDDESIADSDRIIFSPDFIADPFLKSDSGNVDYIKMIKKLIGFKNTYTQILKYSKKIILHFHSTDLSSLNKDKETANIIGINNKDSSTIIGATFVSFNIDNGTKEGNEKQVEDVNENEIIRFVKINIYFQHDIYDYRLLVANCHEILHALSYAKLIGKYPPNDNLSEFKEKYRITINTNDAVLEEHIEISRYTGLFKNLCDSVMMYLINYSEVNLLKYYNSNGKVHYLIAYVSRDDSKTKAVYYNFYNLFTDCVLSMVNYYYSLDHNDHANIRKLIFYCDLFNTEDDYKNDKKPLTSPFEYSYKYPDE